MSGEIGAAGEIVSGAILARAVEPDTGGTYADAHGHCLNCQTELIGPHCHRCGQSAHIHRTLVSFWHDISHALLHFDGKIWRTLPLLVFHPGQLTRRYVHGERARFISPLALFLFSIFLMFSVFSWVGGSGIKSTTNHNGNDLTAEQIKTEIAVDQAKLAPLKAQRAAEAGKDDEKLDDQISDLESEVGGLQTGMTMKEGISKEVLDKAKIQFHTGSASWNQQLSMQAERAKQNPELLFVKMEQGAHKYSWIIIPLSLPFLWATFFWRRDLKLYDHIVFITYSVCFMIILIVAVALLGSVPVIKHARGPLILFAPPAHIFFQLKGAYSLGNWSALWRTFVMLWAAFIVLTMYAALILVMSLV